MFSGIIVDVHSKEISDAIIVTPCVNNARHNNRCGGVIVNNHSEEVSDVIHNIIVNGLVTSLF